MQSDVPHPGPVRVDELSEGGVRPVHPGTRVVVAGLDRVGEEVGAGWVQSSQAVLRVGMVKMDDSSQEGEICPETEVLGHHAHAVDPSVGMTTMLHTY